MHEVSSSVPVCITLTLHGVVAGLTSLILINSVYVLGGVVVAYFK